MEVAPARAMAEISARLERAFRPWPSRRASSSVGSATDAPRRSFTDEQRLPQVLRNLLSNAMKFTESGSVALRVEPTTEAGFAAAVRGGFTSPTPASASPTTSCG
jgi:signal transduction histidine kinase